MGLVGPFEPSTFLYFCNCTQIFFKRKRKKKKLSNATCPRAVSYCGGIFFLWFVNGMKWDIDGENLCFPNGLGKRGKIGEGERERESSWQKFAPLRRQM